MSRSKKHQQKKSIQQAHQYRTDLGSQSVGINGTYGTSNAYLRGSDEGIDNGYQSNSDLPIAKKERTLILEDWLKEHWLSTLLTAIIIPISGWLIFNVFCSQKDIAVLQVRIQNAEDKLDDIKDTMPNKEALQIQIESIQNDLDNMDYSNIEKRLDEIEKEIMDYDNMKTQEETISQGTE